MPIKRTYADHGDACVTAHAMELISEHWAYIVIRELFLGPKRFTELLDSAHGITPAVLTTRLRELEKRGIVTPRVLDPPARVRVYDLTPWGHDLEPIMHSLGRWAQRSPTLPTGGGLTPDAALLAMRTMAPAGPMDPPIRLQLRLSDGRGAHEISYDYAVIWDRSGLHTDRGRLPRADVAITIDSTTWTNAVFNGATIPPAAVRGDPAELGRFLAGMSPDGPSAPPAVTGPRSTHGG